MSKIMNEKIDFTVYIDGASSGNPGDAGIGVFMKNEREEQVEVISEYIGLATNNFAEYKALVVALQRLLELGAKRISVKSDSELLVKQLKGEYRVKSDNLKDLNDLVIKLSKEFSFISLEHIGREFNSKADKLAKTAIQEHKRAIRMVALP